MEFYDGLLNELSKFNEFVDRAKDDDLSLATVYGMEKSKFILYAMSQQDNKKHNWPFDSKKLKNFFSVHSMVQ